MRVGYGDKGRHISRCCIQRTPPYHEQYRRKTIVAHDLALVAFSSTSRLNPSPKSRISPCTALVCRWLWRLTMLPETQLSPAQVACFIQHLGPSATKQPRSLNPFPHCHKHVVDVVFSKHNYVVKADHVVKVCQVVKVYHVVRA